MSDVPATTPPDVNQRVARLVESLGFGISEENQATGAIADVPVSLSILSTEPLGLLFQFRVRPAEITAEELTESLPELPVSSGSLDVEDGSLWLVLRDLSSLTNEQLLDWLEELAEALQETELAVGSGCLRCGEAESAMLMNVEGRPTRLCPGCLEAAVQERIVQEAQLNQSTLRSTLGLPGACLFVAVGWAVLWTILDLLLEWGNVRVVEINEVTTLLILGLLGGAGYGLGRPLGATLRTSLAVSRAPVLTSLLFVAGIVVAGEILYVAIYMFRVAGVFDLKIAAAVLGQVMAQYTGFWIFCKLAVVAAVAAFSALAAAERKTIPLNI